MSEVWRATKRTFNEIMEINNSDLSAGSVASGSDSIVRPQSEPSSMNQSRYSAHNKAASLPRLQRTRESIDIDEYHVVDEDGYGFGAVGGPSWDGSGAEAHISRSRSSPGEEGERVSGSFSSYQPRNRYRSNSSDRASMRNRNEEVIVNRLYHR